MDAVSVPAGIAIERHGGERTRALLPELGRLYLEVYAEPPYNEGPGDVPGFLKLLDQQSQRSGFWLVTARQDGELVGFTLGYALASDTAWWSGMFEPLPGELTREDGRRTLVIIELVVRASLRRRGIARAMHAELVADRDVERVALSVRPEPEAAPAQAAYRAWGYRGLGLSRPWDTAPVYRMMLLDLRPSAPQ